MHYRAHRAQREILRVFVCRLKARTTHAGSSNLMFSYVPRLYLMMNQRQTEPLGFCKPRQRVQTLCLCNLRTPSLLVHTCGSVYVSHVEALVGWVYLLTVAVLHKNMSRVARLRPAEEARDEFSVGLRVDYAGANLR